MKANIHRLETNYSLTTQRWVGEDCKKKKKKKKGEWCQKYSGFCGPEVQDCNGWLMLPTIPLQEQKPWGSDGVEKSPHNYETAYLQVNP